MHQKEETQPTLPLKKREFSEERVERPARVSTLSLLYIYLERRRRKIEQKWNEKRKKDDRKSRTRTL